MWLRCASNWRAAISPRRTAIISHFALGKALEDAGRYEESFRHYEAGNTLRRAGTDYDADESPIRCGG